MALERACLAPSGFGGALRILEAWIVRFSPARQVLSYQSSPFLLLMDSSAVWCFKNTLHHPTAAYASGGLDL